MSFRFAFTLQDIVNLIPSFICCVCSSEREELQMSRLYTPVVFTVVSLGAWVILFQVDGCGC